MSTKKVTVFSTVGGSKVIETSALNWAELQKDLGKAGVSYSGMKAVDGGTKHTFESPEATLPEGDMNLFLFPVQTKSGVVVDASGFSFSECRNFIKEAFESDKDRATSHFNADKNYTNKSTDELRRLISSYDANPGKKGAASSSKPADAPKSTSTAVGRARNVADVIESVTTPKKSVVRTQKADKPIAEKTSSETGLVKFDTFSEEQKCDHIVSLINQLSGSKDLKNDAISIVNRLKPGVKPEVDENALRAQAREIGKGLSGIKSF